MLWRGAADDDDDDEAEPECGRMGPLLLLLWLRLKLSRGVARLWVLLVRRCVGCGCWWCEPLGVPSGHAASPSSSGSVDAFESLERFSREVVAGVAVAVAASEAPALASSDGASVDCRCSAESRGRLAGDETLEAVEMESEDTNVELSESVGACADADANADSGVGRSRGLTGGFCSSSATSSEWRRKLKRGLDFARDSEDRKKRMRAHAGR
ncbi:hypothetical protein ATCC90586_010793 [Pythium insidiosum]|nr:hypothetical protein ATCC90586_010793 [Pythium insidiosum]